MSEGPFELNLHLRSSTSFETLDAHFWRVATPGSSQYLSFYRSPEALADLFGSSQSTVKRAIEWLRSLNGTDIRVSPMRDRITATFLGFQPAGLFSARGLPLYKPTGVHIITRSDTIKMASPKRVASRSPLRDGYSVARQKAAYQIPTDRTATNPSTLQMVWGPGTFGFSPSGLEAFRRAECPGLNPAKVKFDTVHHGHFGGDNWFEGTLDTHMISAFGMNASTLVSNTNTSSSTEESNGFGLALLDFLSELANRPTVPQVLSLSLGSLSAYSCDLLCSKAAETGLVSLQECQEYLQSQRQVCMFTSQDEVSRINQGLMALGLRGVSIFGSSGDGGSHWSFGRFHGIGKVPTVLNKIGCSYMFPIFPSPSPYMVSVGGSTWKDGDPNQPVMWEGSGGGFSWQFGRPGHQEAAVSGYLRNTAGLPPSSSFNASNRAYPDISAVAVEGTSESSPVFAGIFTLVIDARLNAGLPPLGPLGPRIYKTATAHPGEAFEDITEGNTKTSCASGFPAAKGWDPATGWGRPRWKGLLEHFGSDDGIPKIVTAIEQPDGQ